MPVLDDVWVWPPQTSMSVHGRVVTAACDLGEQLPRERRVAVLVEVLHGGVLSAAGRRSSAELGSSASPIARRISRIRCASASSTRERAKPTWTMHVVADAGLGTYSRQTSLADAAEVDLAHEQAVLVAQVATLAGDAEAHVDQPPPCRPVAAAATAAWPS